MPASKDHDARRAAQLGRQLRALPSIDRLLNSPELAGLVDEFGFEACKRAARDELAGLRTALRDGDPVVAARVESDDFPASVFAALQRRVRARFSASLRPAFNLSGVVVHTNLGRSILPPEALQAIAAAAANACNLEYDLATGQRGERDEHVEALLCELTGAEAATVVNNNAAAVLLMLNTLAAGREVLVSRGELVEIGGSFRMPEVMQAAHCILREVGTTNRTHRHDYASAIGENTALLLKVHTSNYAVRGFSKSVSGLDLGELARERGLPFCHDLGSGALVELERFGLPQTLTVAEALAEGAGLVSFSGDKLLGGVQAGLIVGRKDLITRLKRNPLKRALRADKVTLAMLDATLKLYEAPDQVPLRLPLMRLLTTPLTDLEARAIRLRDALAKWLPNYHLDVANSAAQIGSGSVPHRTIESRAVVIHHAQSRQVQELDAKLRNLREPLIGRIRQGALWLDVRAAADFEGLIAAVEQLAAEPMAEDKP